MRNAEVIGNFTQPLDQRQIVVDVAGLETRA